MILSFVNSLPIKYVVIFNFLINRTIMVCSFSEIFPSSGPTTDTTTEKADIEKRRQEAIQKIPKS